MKPRSAVKTSLFAAKEREQKLDRKGDLLATLEKPVDFTALALEVDRIAPRTSDKRGGRPSYPTELMVRVLILQQLYNLSDDSVEYQLLDRSRRQTLLRQTSCRCSFHFPAQAILVVWLDCANYTR